MGYGERDNQRGDKTRAARTERARQQINRAHRADVREGGYGARHESHVREVGGERGFRDRVDGAKQVEREAAVWKPARVPRAALRVEQDGEVGQRRRRNLGGVAEYRALVRVGRPCVAVVPVQPVEAQRERERHYGEYADGGGARARGVDARTDAGGNLRQRAASSLAARAAAVWKSVSTSARRGMAS